MKDSENLIWDQLRIPSAIPFAPSSSSSSHFKTIPKFLFCFILFLSLIYLLYSFKLLSSRDCHEGPFSTRLLSSRAAVPNLNVSESQQPQKPTELRHVVFGIAASSKLWEHRKKYIKLWYNSTKMRGVVWLDDHVETHNDDGLPLVKISGDTSNFSYTHPLNHRAGIRISRIVSETLRLGMKDVRWFVMGDDDTVFFTDNLLRVLRKYDHNQFYYIGGSSESHMQNIYLSYSMAFGGGGFAISYPLAKALDKIQDHCIQRYPALYGSDDRIQACMAELGVPLTKELGFHQFDVHGNLLGLLAAHPVSPLVTMHHLDLVEPIFPNVTQIQALERLMTTPMKLDSASLMQQSICYDKARSWTVSVSWGFAILIFRGLLPPREMETPSRTFLNWHKKADFTGFPFNTRPVARNPCQKPFVFYLSNSTWLNSMTQLSKQVIIVSEYQRHRAPHPECRWKMTPPSTIDIVKVYKKPDPHLWDRAPRRNCCRVKESPEIGILLVDVGVCEEGEVSEF
ncbi:hypothetical protein QN277_003720 [Acacia crassicarpa]|uniref:Uncharacterized protein n=1 Tax=Acacia crassicarpa TaxID=499986 RepID=A0AAE1J1F1_9FABA|nr:hypothetical protein QN277_003720 [Acacia crassicarpa]